MIRFNSGIELTNNNERMALKGRKVAPTFFDTEPKPKEKKRILYVISIVFMIVATHAMKRTNSSFILFCVHSSAAYKSVYSFTRLHTVVWVSIFDFLFSIQSKCYGKNVFFSVFH